MQKPMHNSFKWVFSLVVMIRRQIEQIKGFSYWFKVGIKHICNFSAFINYFFILY